MIKKYVVTLATLFAIMAMAPLPNTVVHADENNPKGVTMGNFIPCPSKWSNATFCFNGWKLTGYKTPLSNAKGYWRVCDSVQPSPYVQQLTCDIGKSSSHTVTTSVSGGIHVGIVDLSASVGYDVNHTSSVNAINSATIPRYHYAEIDWAPWFIQRYRVQQLRGKCAYFMWHDVSMVCSWSNPPYYAYANTERFTGGVSFRTIQR